MGSDNMKNSKKSHEIDWLEMNPHDKTRLVDRVNGYEAHAASGADGTENGGEETLGPSVPPVGKILVKESVSHSTRHLWISTVVITYLLSYS